LRENSLTSRFFGLIPAAGSGSRFGEAAPKQYYRLTDKPMLRHAVQSLLCAREIDTVFVVLATGDAEFRKYDWSEFGERLAPLYCGGTSRRDSVLNGIIASASAVDAGDWVLVHDAARPCLGKAKLARLITEVRDDEVGGILAVPVADTLKRADDERRIVATEPRDRMWQAQTPQMFRHAVLLRALGEHPGATDEAAAVEAMGLKPKLVEGRSTNLKVTYPADLELAELILRGKMGQSNISKNGVRVTFH
jgi:2-C-methyl-D-erythritol 4-phosphate cytidylyltransferase